MKDAILMVDDEPHVISSLKRALIDDSYDIHTALSGAEGLDILKKHPIKVVISDERMPEMNGAEFLSRVKIKYPDTIRMLLTGHTDLDAAIRAVNDGEIYRFFTKPWDDHELKLTILSALERYNLEEENRRLLKMVRRQAVDLKLLEKRFPSITELNRDENGTIILPDISPDEFSQIVARCEQEYS